MLTAGDPPKSLTTTTTAWPEVTLEAKETITALDDLEHKAFPFDASYTAVESALVYRPKFSTHANNQKPTNDATPKHNRALGREILPISKSRNLFSIFNLSN